MPGLQSADIPQVNRGEAQAAVFGPNAKGVDAQVISQVQKIKAEQAKSAKNAAVELARLNLDGNVRRWEGDRGDRAKEQFRNQDLGERARKATEKANLVKRGMDLLSLDGTQRDAKFLELKNANMIDPGTMTVDAYIEAACTEIANLRDFGAYFPDVAANATPAERIQLVRDHLATNPVLRTQLGDLMGKVQEKMAAFSDVPETQTGKIDRQISDEQTKQSVAKGRLDDIISNTLGIKKSDLKGARRAAMETALASGDKDAVMRIVTEIKGFTADEVAKIREYNEDMATLKKQREALANASATNLPVIQAEIARLEAIKTAGPPPKGLEYNAFQTIIDSPPFTGNLDAYTEAGAQIDKLQEDKLKLPINMGERQAAAKRQAEEEAVVMEMENALDRALLNTYDQSVDSYREAKQANTEQAVKDAEAANRVDEARMYTSRLKEWIEATQKGVPEKVHIDRIMRDMNIMSQSGDRGIKFFIARDAGLFDTGLAISFVDSTGTTRTGTGADLVKWVYDGTLSAEEAVARLDSSRTDRLKQLLTKKDADGATVDSGVIEDYRNTLIGDYMTGLRYVKQKRFGRAMSYGRGNKRLELHDENGIIKEGTFGTEILTEYEKLDSHWREIRKHYNGDEIDQALEKDANVRRFMEKMKAKGIIAEPKTKWLLYMLLVMGLFAVPGLGAGAALGGIGGAAGLGAEIGGIAAGAAGLKVGQATKDQFIQ